MKSLLISLLLFTFSQVVHAAKPPKGWIMKQRWSKLGFAHFEVEPELIEPLIPKPLKLDTYGGYAYVGVLALEMTSGKAPYLPIPLYRKFSQVNLRTYATYQGKRGVYFISLDASHWLSVKIANKVFNLPYKKASVIHRGSGNGNHSISFTRENEKGTSFGMSYKPIGPIKKFSKNSLEYWQTELMRYFQVNKKGCVIAAELWHEPFKIREAVGRVWDSTLLNELPFFLDISAGSYHYSKGIETYFWPPKKLGCH